MVVSSPGITKPLGVKAGTEPGQKEVLLKCQRGCTAREILDSLDLDPELLSHTITPKKPLNWAEAKTWDYGDKIRVFRFDLPNGKKDIRQGPAGARKPGRTKRIDKSKIPLLYQDELEELSAGSHVWITEGETCADALRARPGGHVAVTQYQGGKQPWPERYTKLFDGLVVSIWADRDTVGYQRALRVYEALQDVAKAVRVVRTPIDAKGADAVDHLAAGLRLGMGEDGIEALGIEELRKLAGSIEKPYEFSPTGAPFKFTEELIDRHFRDERGVLTLRFHDSAQFWTWDADAVRYVLLTEQEIQEHVSRITRDIKVLNKDGDEVDVNLKPQVVRGVIDCLRSDTLNSSRAVAPALLPSKGGVPFLNGWLDVNSRKLQPIGPERDVRWNVPVDYLSDEASCTAWFDFLDSLGWTEGTDERRLLRQWFGYLLSGRTDMQKALLMHGQKRAGKGTILKVAKAMLGDGAVGTQLDKFSQNFGMENFIGAGLVMVSDARFGRAAEPKVVERILSLVADDEMTVDTKFGKVRNLRLGVRLMIATNEVPRFIEASDAAATRFIILPFTKSFYGHEDLGLEERLMGELPGIVQWALGGIDDLNEAGSFCETEAGREIQEEMILDAAPVRRFVDECCEVGEGFRVSNDDLYARYRIWAEANGMFVLPSNMFSRDLHTAFPGQIKTKTFKKGGASVRGQRGIKTRGQSWKAA